MKFFIDSGDIDEIKRPPHGASRRRDDQPFALRQERQADEEALAEICEIVDGPISGEVLATTTRGSSKRGAKSPNPQEPGGEGAAHLRGAPRREDVPRRGHPHQRHAVLLRQPGAARRQGGCSYISPFIGRIDDTSHEGMQLIEQIITIYQNYGFQTEVLVASVRSPTHVLQAAQLGADICTIPFKVIEQLAYHPLTDIGLAKFLEDGKKIPKG